MKIQREQPITVDIAEHADQFSVVATPKIRLRDMESRVLKRLKR